jgi:UV DNA damage endonuclease
VIRFGLCCIFRDEPVKFRTTTAAALQRLSRREARRKLAGLCAQNAATLLSALQYCAAHGIGCFRVVSQLVADLGIQS